MAQVIELGAAAAPPGGSSSSSRTAHSVSTSDLPSSTEGELTTSIVIRNLHQRPWLERELLKLVLLLILGGALAGALSVTIDACITALSDLMRRAANAVDHRGVAYAIWLACVSTLTTAAVALTIFISPGAAGSGVGELKSVLSGAPVPHDHFSFRMLMVKSLGLVFGLAGGAVLGKEGPMIHLACIIFTQLLRTPYFRTLTRNPRLVQQALAAACAAGVAANFAAPIGGILFAVEATSTVFPVREFQFAAIAALAAGFVSREGDGIKRNTFHLWLNRPELPLPDVGVVPSGPFVWPFYIILAVVVGLCAVLLLRCISHWQRTVARLSKHPSRVLSSPFFYALLVSVVVSLITFPRWGYSLLGLRRKPALTLLLNPNEESSAEVAVFLVTRAVGMVLCLPLVMPGGVIVPSFLVGACLGRLEGAALRAMFGRSMPGPAGGFTSNVFAVVGSAAFSGSITQVISCAVVLFEMTGNIDLLSQVLITTVIAYSISRGFSLSVFDLLLKRKANVYLPDLDMNLWMTEVRHMIETSIPFVPLAATASALETALGACTLSAVPVVSDAASMVLVGTITRAEGSAWLSQADVTKDAPVASAPLKRSLVTITEQIPLEEFHLLIIALRCNELFVVREGRLLGAVSRQRYKATLARLEKGKHSLLHCMGLC